MKMQAFAPTDFFNNFLDFILRSADLDGRNFLDIIIISFLIFLAVKFLRETHSIPVVIGVLTLLGFYGIALLFDLPLTVLVLRSFFGVFLILVAVIFQRELRRFFSTFGFSALSRRFLPPRQSSLEAIAAAVSHLVGEKTGALVVFPGREPIERFFEGGYKLNGEISEPLLLSIFDETSPGHDGATVIENNLVKKFAVHLPLSEHVEKTKHFGLRHRAALGLSERSDALIIVISEEKGIISIARNGKLNKIKNEENLMRELTDFYEEKFPRRNQAAFLGWIWKNFALFLVSFLLALGAFSLVNSRFAFVQRNFIAIPEFSNIPDKVLINDVIPQEVILTLRGRSSDFEVFKPESARVLIDASVMKDIIKPGWHRVPIENKNVLLPRFNLSLVKIEPLSIRVQVVENKAGQKAAF